MVTAPVLIISVFFFYPRLRSMSSISLSFTEKHITQAGFVNIEADKRIKKHYGCQLLCLVILNLKLFQTIEQLPQSWAPLPKGEKNNGRTLSHKQL